MPTPTEIANMALVQLGQDRLIDDLETDQTPPAKLCRQFFTQARNETLRDFAWPFATKIVALALVEETPSAEWGYSYRYPSDCRFFRRIVSGDRNDTRESRVKYRILHDIQGRLIYTDQSEAEGEYTVDVDPQFYPEDFVGAVAYRLALLIAPGLVKTNVDKLIVRLAELYTWQIKKAQANALNEQALDIEPESPSIRARE